MPLAPAPDPRAVPLARDRARELSGWLERQDAPTRAWVGAWASRPVSASCSACRRRTARSPGALVGWGTPEARRRDRFQLAAAAAKLPAGTYAALLEGVGLDPGLEALGWLMADYRFDRYRPDKPPRRELVCPEGVDAARIERIAEAAALAQDLIDTPARDMGPEALEAAFVALAERHGAEARVTRGAGGAQGREPADDRGGGRRGRRAAAAARPRLGARTRRR